MEEWKDIIVVDSLGIVKTDIEEQYLSHLLCLGGTCRFFFNGQEFELREGDLSIIRRRSLVEKLTGEAVEALSPFGKERAGFLCWLARALAGREN